jgi:tetratricopeptide (TPR) repeat protein
MRNSHEADCAVDIPHSESRTPHSRVAEFKRRHDWEALAALSAELPASWGKQWVPTAREVAFALTQLGRLEEARTLFQRAYEVDPDHRTASALAYVHYAALLRHKIRKRRLDEPEPWRKGFERWITEALRLKPDSIVDRYRLGIYHASIQACKDVVALKAFRDVIALFERSDPHSAFRTPHFKTYIRSLYAAARSAYRLRRYVEARRYIFRCIRLDAERHHQKPVFKLFLAAKILVEESRLEDAERGLRLALDAPHQGDRDFVYALLAEIALRQDRVDDAAGWIELNIRPHHRKPYVWRLLGDCEARRGRPERAIKLYKSALLKDRGGRHLTLVRIGRLHEAAGRTREALRTFEQAADFRRRRYLSEDPEALECIARLHEREGNLDGARAAYVRLAKLPLFAEKAERELARLAG